MLCGSRQQIASVSFAASQVQYALVPDELRGERVTMQVFVADFGAFKPGNVSFASPLQHGSVPLFTVITPKVPVHHLFDQAFERPPVFPAELFLSLSCVALEQADIRGTEKRRVLDDISVGLQSNAIESNVDEFANGVRLAAGDDVIVRLLLLQHGPHRDDVVSGVPPVATRVQISEIQLVGQTQLDLRNMRGDLSRHKFVPAARALVIEQNSAGGVKVISLTIIPRQMIAGDFGNAISGARVEWCFFILRRNRSLA